MRALALARQVGVPAGPTRSVLFGRRCGLAMKPRLRPQPPDKKAEASTETLSTQISDHSLRPQRESR